MCICNILNFPAHQGVSNLDFTADYASNTVSIHIFPTDGVVTWGTLGRGEFLSFMCNDLVLLHLHHCTAIYFKLIPKRLSFRQ